jgi:hypothetical protein
VYHIDVIHVAKGEVVKTRSSYRFIMATSYMDAHVLPKLPVPKYGCGKPVDVCQPSHPNTVACFFYIYGGFIISNCFRVFY